MKEIRISDYIALAEYAPLDHQCGDLEVETRLVAVSEINRILDKITNLGIEVETYWAHSGFVIAFKNSHDKTLFKVCG